MAKQQGLRTYLLLPASGQTEWFYGEVRCPWELQKVAYIHGKEKAKRVSKGYKRIGVLERPKISATWT